MFKKKWLRISLMVILGIILSSSVLFTYIYFKLEPDKYFSRIQLPILAKPIAETTEVGELTAPGSLNKDIPVHSEIDLPEFPSEAELEVPINNKEKKRAKKSGPQSFNLLLLGIDAIEQEESRTDVIMLVHVNPEEDQISLVSIPRDTRVPLPGIGQTKINHAHILAELEGGNKAGTEATLQAVSNLCSCSIHYYFKTYFQGFERFIDTLGGLDIQLDTSFLEFPAGKHHFDGKQALSFVRERDSLPDGDHGRQAHQAKIVKAIILKLLEPQNIVQLPALYSKVREDIIDTNLLDQEIASLAWLTLMIKGENIQHLQFPGEAAQAFDPVIQQDLYYWFPNRSAWKKILNEIF